MTMPSFILPANNGKATPQSVERKRRMAQSLMEQGMQTGPIGHWSQGLARMVQSLTGGLASRRADEQDFALQAETKKEQMARQLLMDNRYTDELKYNRGRDAKQDAWTSTQNQYTLEQRQLEADRREAQQGVYEGQINQTNTHQGGMQGPQQPSYSPEQSQQAQMYAAGGDYGKASELLNPMPDPMKPTDDIINYEYGKKNPGFKGAGGGPFEGNSVEAQSLNMLIQNGAITPEQAAQLGAGKTMTAPTTGAVIFLTPQGVFSKPNPNAEPGGIPEQPSGNIEIMPGNKSLFNESQGKAAGFADRMAQSMPLIEQYSEAGTNFKDRAVDALLPDIIGNYAKSDDYKLMSQAQRDFINSQLRRESGAVINPEEFENAKQQYFPQPDDNPELIEQKRLNREAAFEAMQRDAGPAYRPKKDTKKRSTQELLKMYGG